MTVGCFRGVRYETTMRKSDSGPFALKVGVAGMPSFDAERSTSRWSTG